MATKPFKRCDCKAPAKCEHSWLVRWWEDGGTRQRERSFKLNRPAAVEFAKKIDGETLAARKQYGSKPDIRFADYAASWLDGKCDNRKPGTVTVYESMMRVHLIPVLGSRKLADVAADRAGVEKLLRG